MPATELRERSGLRLRAFLLFSVCFVLTSATSWPQDGAAVLHAVDFKNFEYPWVEPNGYPDHLQWMSLAIKQRVRLIGGKSDDRDENEIKSGLPFAGLSLEGVQYARLSSDRAEDAIVVLRYDSGGTQNHYWIYIYGAADGAPKLLGFLHAGDRADHGLYQVFAKGRVLNVELFDPKFKTADCCSTHYLNYRFRWNGKGFEAIGSPISGRAGVTSRRPVSVFGLPAGE
jgi:hypothetical protein